MDRRQLLKTGLGIGFLIMERASAPPDVEAAPTPKVRFYDGTLDADCNLYLAISGKHARGFAYDPASISTTPIGYRMGGSFNHNQLNLNLYGITDVRETTVLGSLQGDLSHGMLAGDFTLSAGGGGTFSTDFVPLLSGKKLRPFLGGWTGDARGFGMGDPQFTGKLTLNGNGLYSLTKIETDDLTGVPTRLSGKFGFSDPRTCWMCPTPFRVPDDDFCERPFFCPPVVRLDVLGGGTHRGDTVQFTNSLANFGALGDR